MRLPTSSLLSWVGAITTPSADPSEDEISFHESLFSLRSTRGNKAAFDGSSMRRRSVQSEMKDNRGKRDTVQQVSLEHRQGQLSTDFDIQLSISKLSGALQFVNGGSFAKKKQHLIPTYSP